MNIYTSIAALAFIGMMFLPTKMAGLWGTILLALVWPVILVTLSYLFIKLHVFRRRGLSNVPWISSLEILGCLLVTNPVIILVLYLQHDPFAINLIKSL